MRSVPPAEFEREAAVLSPSKSFSNLRTESMVQPVSRQIAIRGKRNRFILPAPRVLALVMRLSSRHRFDLPLTRMLHHRLPFRQGFSFCRWRARQGERFRSWQAFRSRIAERKTSKSGNLLYFSLFRLLGTAFIFHAALCALIQRSYGAATAISERSGRRAFGAVRPDLLLHVMHHRYSSDQDDGRNDPGDAHGSERLHHLGVAVDASRRCSVATTGD